MLSHDHPRLPRVGKVRVVQRGHLQDFQALRGSSETVGNREEILPGGRVKVVVVVIVAGMMLIRKSINICLIFSLLYSIRSMQCTSPLRMKPYTSMPR